jgi:hypothetical protein
MSLGGKLGSESVVLRDLKNVQRNAVNTRCLNHASGNTPLTITSSLPSHAIADEMTGSTTNVPLPCMRMHSKSPRGL